MSGPKPVLRVPLVARKVPALIGHLDYTKVLLPNSQKRLAGRYALQPEIDLSKFTTRAVIDWVTIGVLLDRTTQFQWIQREIEGLLGRVPHVDNGLRFANDPSVQFDIKIQEPDMLAVRRAVAALDAKFGLAMDACVRSIEISVDFTPRKPSDLDRAQMARVLSNHLLVRPDVTSNLRDRPRTVWGGGPDKTMRLLYDSARLTEEENQQFLVSADRDGAPFTDGTLEVGAMEADTRWRVMDKVIDRQNRQAGTFLALDDRSKRTRVEVTLDRPEVAALGVTFLDDLKTLNFTGLQGRYFRFFLPTFSRQAALQPDVRAAMELWRDRQRTIKFSKTGNLGLKAMDEAMAERHADLKREALPDLHKRRLRLPRTKRTGSGLAGSFVAYEEMNARVLTALRNLGKRVVADFGPDV